MNEEEELKDYEQNRAINDAFRFDQPNRAFEQYKTILEYFPKPTLADTSEKLADFKAGATAGSILQEYVPLPKGVVPALTGAATVVVKRINPVSYTHLTLPTIVSV